MGDVTALLEKAVEGDARARDDLYRLTEPELRKLALHWIARYSSKGPVRITEVIDLAYVRLMKLDAPGWRHRGQFYAYACRNVMCVLLDLLGPINRHRAEQLPAEIEARRGPLTVHSLVSLHQALENLGRDLTEMHRVIVELRFLGECTLDEVAELLSVSRDEVFRKSRVALEYLRKKLAASFPDFGRPADYA